MRARAIVALGAVGIYAAGSFIFLLSQVPPPAPYPHLELASRDGGKSFRVTAAEPGLQWEDFRPIGCNRRPSGSVDVGDELTGCAGSVVLQYTGGA